MTTTKNKTRNKRARSTKPAPVLIAYGKVVANERGDLTQSEFGKAMGLSPGLVSHIENGIRVPVKWYSAIEQSYGIAAPAILTAPASGDRSKRTRTPRAGRRAPVNGTPRSVAAFEYSTGANAFVEGAKFGRMLESLTGLGNYVPWANAIACAEKMGLTMEQFCGAVRAFETTVTTNTHEPRVLLADVPANGRRIHRATAQA